MRRRGPHQTRQTPTQEYPQPPKVLTISKDFGEEIFEQVEPFEEAQGDQQREEDPWDGAGERRDVEGRREAFMEPQRRHERRERNRPSQEKEIIGAEKEGLVVFKPAQHRIGQRLSPPAPKHPPCSPHVHADANPPFLIEPPRLPKAPPASWRRFQEAFAYFR